MAEGDCGHHGNRTKKLCCCVLGFILTLIILALLIFLLIWLIDRPTKPQFILQNVTLETSNFSSSANLLTSNFQITLYSRNPNNRIGIYYDNLDVFATYQGEQITLPYLLPPTYQGHKEVCLWSPLILIGDDVPVSPYLENSLTHDQMAGIVLINIKVDGNMRRKVGTSVSPKIHLTVNCPLYITYGSKNKIGSAIGPAEINKYQLDQSCNVDY